MFSPNKVVYEICEAITVTKVLKLYATIFSNYDDTDISQDEITMPADEFGSVNFVGDSRRNYVDDAAKEYQSNTGKVHFVAKGGMHFLWFVEEGYPLLLSQIEKICNTTGKPIALPNMAAIRYFNSQIRSELAS